MRKTIHMIVFLKFLFGFVFFFARSIYGSQAQANQILLLLRQFIYFFFQFFSSTRNFVFRLRHNKKNVMLISENHENKTVFLAVRYGKTGTKWKLNLLLHYLYSINFAKTCSTTKKTFFWELKAISNCNFNSNNITKLIFIACFGFVLHDNVWIFNYFFTWFVFFCTFMLWKRERKKKSKL